jgi:hypothetical protein
MNPEIKIPDNAVKYILFQRTAYLVIPRNIFYKKLNKLSPWSLYNFVVLLESACRKKSVKRLFNDDMQNEYESIRSFLPENCSKILDIGCGVAGIDVLLHRHYDCDNDIKFYLLDKTNIDKKVYYFFEKKGSFYNSLQIAKRILCDNGIPRKNIYLLEVTADHDIKAESGLDLVISLISWGFHYPVSVYLEQVYDSLNQGGRLIMDIRQSTGGQKELEQKFAKVTIISDDNFLRVSATK